VLVEMNIDSKIGLIYSVVDEERKQAYCSSLSNCYFFNSWNFIVAFLF